jgi:hypothetical protein
MCASSSQRLERERSSTSPEDYGLDVEARLE